MSIEDTPSKQSLPVDDIDSVETSVDSGSESVASEPDGSHAIDSPSDAVSAPSASDTGASDTVGPTPGDQVSSVGAEPSFAAAPSSTSASSTVASPSASSATSTAASSSSSTAATATATATASTSAATTTGSSAATVAGTAGAVAGAAAGLSVGAIVAVIAGILVVAAVVVGSVVLNQSPSSPIENWFDPSAQSGSFEGKSKEEIQKALDEEVAKGMMNVSIASSVVFADGSSEGDARIENIAANSMDQKITITLKDSGETVYESGALAPGQHIQTIKLSQSLAAGTYPAIATFTGYDKESHKQTGQAAAEIVIDVEG